MVFRCQSVEEVPSASLEKGGLARVVWRNNPGNSPLKERWCPRFDTYELPTQLVTWNKGGWGWFAIYPQEHVQMPNPPINSRNCPSCRQRKLATAPFPFEINYYGQWASGENWVSSTNMLYLWVTTCGNVWGVLGMGDPPCIGVNLIAVGLDL